ncbi:NADH-quinone oxidoreductase subunit NuoN [Roseobacter sp. HKCCD9010]|uniref:NADH-quinone oxidoreductase subunit NuoN n=1 Tax=unclassified Roseobacter TaxID=196798 RepID=UPI0014919F6D|nr:MULTISPECIES: NADH-quinone oxidoreductase subunit NuoN [unclassified Roseobacter]MBF9049339.1 NADH-quinone oxidoreductase subunit NuoN [Rhodobacterales bacterium HKCCD4356]NNV11339.1 NADH-quinone oxidoreductase subunit NuoN [Roseobacter sp. HKCCD7357]NNV15523.1 NADH-quinone oxidoreductase subunit NuoN [Roseobacter sp. HKCCD8768]NNV24983.1 NADH-quinone oxidoreductase subunit NuoN [Roseobacter sp. HKCCD8192]NNV29240.1 NADH-quinone oxidoreductase subunit NuoN [Roseobacter sp. HKCCD9061]
MIGTDLSILIPEIVLAIYAMVGLIGAVYTSKDGMASTLTYATAALFVVMAFYIGVTAEGTRIAFGGMFIDDGFARFAKITILLSAAAILLVSHDYMEKSDLLRFEYPMLITLATVGMMMMVSAGDLMALYMGLELQSLSLYVIASLRRDSVRSTEAGLKYFILGALSSGLLLYGASLVYGFAGTTLFSGIIEAATGGEASLGLLFGLAFLIAGMAFKVSAAPFHMWTPDVYEGSPTPVTAFFATAPKVAAMALFARVVHDAFGGVVGDWQQIVAFLAVFSMFLGAIAAIGQTDIKRLMAYSSISHMGFALMGLSAGTEQGVTAMLIYMAIYVTMNIGTFAFILSMEKDGRHVTEISSLNSFASKEPLKALAILVLMFSLAGVPPLVGFFGKYAVLLAAVDAGLVWLAVAGVIASVIGAFYYLRIVYFMYFGADEDGLDGQMGMVPWVGLMASAAIMLFGVINLFGVDGLAEAAAATLVR